MAAALGYQLLLSRSLSLFPCLSSPPSCFSSSSSVSTASGFLPHLSTYPYLFSSLLAREALFFGSSGLSRQREQEPPTNSQTEELTRGQRNQVLFGVCELQSPVTKAKGSPSHLFQSSKIYPSQERGTVLKSLSLQSLDLRVGAGSVTLFLDKCQKKLVNNPTNICTPMYKSKEVEIAQYSSTRRNKNVVHTYNGLLVNKSDFPIRATTKNSERIMLNKIIIK